MFALNSLARWRRPRSEAQSSADLAFEETDPATGGALSFVEADWLLRVLLSCFGLTVCAWQPLPPVSCLRELDAELASRGLALRVAKLRDVRMLRRGDVVRLDPAACARICTTLGGRGLAVVVDDGAAWVRLRAACTVEPMTCPRIALRGLRGARILRVEAGVAAPAGSDWDTGWESGWIRLR